MCPDRSALPHILYEGLPMAGDRGAGWAVLRDLGPVVTGDGWYYLTRRDDVLAALRDSESFSSSRAFDTMVSPVPLIPLACDPPDHTRYRRLLHSYFSPQTLGRMLPSMQAQAVDIIDRIALGDECEVMADLATPYPSQVFLTLLGLPLSDRQRLIAWKDAVIGISLDSDPDPAALVPAAELLQYLSDAVTSHRDDPGDDMLSRLLTGDDALTDHEALGLAFVLVLAGLDTVTSAIGAAMLELARRPGLRTELCDNPSAIPGFVEEILRLEPPAPVVGRVTTRPVTVAGHTIPAGAEVRLCLGAINRDGSDATSGDDLILDGRLHRHWGFGGGAHRCLGSHLARMELNLVVTEWLRRIPEFELATDHTPEITWPAATCTLPRLPVRFLAKEAP
ncbi:cytochrome P450 [Mycobacterium sp. NPDC050551]|uniref:cytochrome P450 n=1 Tax=Mycobacterium sp. NPDC050551 TaxID=3155407 RepID=UPI00341F837A